MSASSIDSVTLTIINNCLVNTCREMGLAMMKTSYSSIFNEGLDFSCVIFDRDGEMIASAEFCPAQIGAILYTMQWTIAEIGAENFEPGDVVMHNDPYRGGCHMPEHTVIKAVYHQGELFGFVGNIAHVTEIGGKAVGGFAADAKEVYQEGLRLPPVKIVRKGKNVEDIWNIILANHRTPRTSWGDFHAMIGSLHVAEQRLHELLGLYGFNEILSAGKQLMDYSEARMRAEVAELPDGQYSFEDWIENDGVVADQRYRIHCTVTICGDGICFDYHRSSPQARGPCNCTYGVTASATFNAMLNITDETIPKNSGCYRPIELVVPPGTIVNVEHPGPSVGGNSEVHERIVDVLFGCFSQAVPERIAAATGGSSCNFLFGGIDPESGQYYANYHIEGCGWGAKIESDGNPVQCPINGNCRNTPVEVFETRYPWITETYRIAKSSGGPGRHRGGEGSFRIFKCLAKELTVSSFMDRHETRAWGLFGGGEGASGDLKVRKSGTSKWRCFSDAYGTVSPNKFADIQIQSGDEIKIVSPGGGGYGPPEERDPDLVLEDVMERFVTGEQAREIYRVALIDYGHGDLRIDEEATNELRRYNKPNSIT
jgi:N-methylhydantoinase B/oxoprolinase/acetone carboxylase alpha subunit